MQSAIDLARERVRDGLPLRAPIAVVGYVARKPATAKSGTRMRAGVEAGVEAATGDRRWIGARYGLPRRTRAVRRRAAPVRRRHRGSRLRHERVEAVGSPADGPGRVVRPARAGCSPRFAHHPPARHPGRGVRIDPGRRVLLAGMGQEAGRRGGRRCGRRCAAGRRRAARPVGAGAGQVGSPDHPGSQRHRGRRCPSAARRRLRRCADLRDHGLRRPSHRLLHRQRCLGFTARPRAGRHRSGASPRRRHVRAPDRHADPRPRRQPTRSA